jgi:hypothetical protein
MQTGETTIQQINSAIVNHNYGYSENRDKPGPLRESVFQGESYKLKYNASQTRLFLRILPFILGPLIDTSSEYYSFLVEIIQITQVTTILYSCMHVMALASSLSEGLAVSV